MSPTRGARGTIRGARGDYGGGILPGGIIDITTVTIGTTEVKIPLVGIFVLYSILFSRDKQRAHL